MRLTQRGSDCSGAVRATDERVGAGAGLPSTADRRGHSEGCAGTAATGCEGAGWADPGLLIRCTELGVGHWRLLQMSGVVMTGVPDVQRGGAAL